MKKAVVSCRKLNNTTIVVGNGNRVGGRRVPVECAVLIGGRRKSLGTVTLHPAMNARVEAYAAAKGMEFGEALQALLLRALELVERNKTRKETP